MEIVEARLSVPFLSGEQVIDNRRVVAGPAHQLPVRQIIVSAHDPPVFDDQPRRSREIGDDIVIVAVADKTDEAAMDEDNFGWIGVVRDPKLLDRSLVFDVVGESDETAVRHADAASLLRRRVVFYPIDVFVQRLDDIPLAPCRITNSLPVAS